jgi:hypothetical protein
VALKFEVSAEAGGGVFIVARVREFAPCVGEARGRDEFQAEA